MTALEALQKSMEMWQWLADHPDVSSKWVYFEWAKIVREDQPVNQCYVCDTMLKSENAYECEGGCLIEWIKGIDIPYACEGAETKYDEELEDYVEVEHETPYEVWCSALPEDGEKRKAAALEIVKLHEKTITKFGEDQNGTDKS